MIAYSGNACCPVHRLNDTGCTCWTVKHHCTNLKLFRKVWEEPSGFVGASPTPIHALDGVLSIYSTAFDGSHPAYFTRITPRHHIAHLDASNKGHVRFREVAIPVSSVSNINFVRGVIAIIFGHNA